MYLDLSTLVSMGVTIITGAGLLCKFLKYRDDTNDILKSIIYSNVDYITIKSEKNGSSTHDDVERINKFVETYKTLGGDGGCNHLVDRFNKLPVCQ